MDNLQYEDIEKIELIHIDNKFGVEIIMKPNEEEEI